MNSRNEYVRISYFERSYGKVGFGLDVEILVKKHFFWSHHEPGGMLRTHRHYENLENPNVFDAIK